MASFLLKKYMFLLQTVLDAGEGGITLDRIQQKWLARFGERYTRRTFNNHRAVLDEMFGVTIACNRSDYTYYVSHSDELLEDGSLFSWMLNNFTLGNILTVSFDRLSGRIQVENVPSGQVHLTSILDAMNQNLEIELEYRKYQSTISECLHVRPYGVKEYQKRWYLVAWCHERSALRMYSLDRISSLSVTDTGFTLPKDFTLDELFYDAYGPYIPSDVDKPVNLKLKVMSKEVKYLRDLPMHRSQKEEIQEDGSSIFTYRLHVNEDFYMDLLRLTGKVQVLEPREVRIELERRLRDALRKK